MMLEVNNLGVCYGTCEVIHRISLEVNQGEIVALIGSNGAGKTTILKTISGILRPTSGKIMFDGLDISKHKPHRIVEMGISHVPERRGIFANLTVLENLLMGAYTRHVRLSDFEEIYSLFPILSQRKKQIAGTLSGGEQQMLAMSRALLSKPTVMLLDEPSLGLAPQVTKSIFDTIKRINHAGTTVLLVEQNARAALKISKRGYVLETGKILCTDFCDRLLSNELVKKAYLGEA